MRKILCGAALALALSGCSYVSGLVGTAAQPLTPAQVQQNLANVNYLFQAAGCAVAAEATTAAPIVQISADATGNQVLAAVDAAGTLLCKLTVPPTAIPVPAAPNAPAASAPLAAAPAAPPKTS
jgi:hypothetical protein